MTTIAVISPGPLTTIQDLGRPGWAHIGVPRGGAADRPALRLANRLVGNPEGAPALETTLVGPKLRFHGPAAIALTGAPVRASVGGADLPMNAAITINDGDVLSVGTARTGLRTYVAFAGGIVVALTLGSAATDRLTGIGPAPLARDAILRLGVAPARLPAQAPALEAASGVQLAGQPPPTTPADEPAKLLIALGPREDWFTEGARRRLTSEPFTVTPDANRIGLRLAGPSLERARTEELLSEGMVPGAIQVPPSGDPILLLTDHPTTGGYPVIATVLSGALPLAAQLKPGQQVSFTTAP